MKTFHISYKIHFIHHPNVKIENPQEKFNVFSHLISGWLSIIGLIVLLYKTSNNILNDIIALIFCSSLIFVFFSSALWHSKKKFEDQYSKFTKLDQIAIYCAIAGTFTAISYIFLSGWTRIFTIVNQWIIAGVGILFRLKKSNIKRWMNSIIYLIMGWLNIFSFNQLLQNMPLWGLILFIISVILATIGAIIFARMKPKNYHEIFHILISIAILIQYLVIFFTL